MLLCIFHSASDQIQASRAKTLKYKTLKHPIFAYEGRFENQVT